MNAICTQCNRNYEVKKLQISPDEWIDYPIMILSKTNLLFCSMECLDNYLKNDVICAAQSGQVEKDQ